MNESTDKRTKVLFIIDSLGPGGTERQVVEILKYLSKSKEIQVGLVTFKKDQYYSDEIKKSVKYFKEISKRPIFIRPILAISGSFRYFKPDIVYAWDGLSHFYSYIPSKYYRVKIINASIRDAGVEKGWRKAFKRFFLKRSDMIIANSNTGLKVYGVGGRVIYNAIDLNRFADKKNINEYNMVMTANFTDHKDHQTFFDIAITLVRQNIIDRVFLIGDGPHRKRYEDHINGSFPDVSQRFIFTGTINNVEEYLAYCQVGVLCSKSEYGEGVSNSILEYMAAGLVPIATDIGATSEVIENGKNGFLVKPQDPAEIIEIIKLLRTDNALANTIRTNAEETIRQRFNYQGNIKKIESVFLGLSNKNV